MAGTVNIARDLWDDPTFKDAEMSQREAWVWMIAEASWKQRSKRVGSAELCLERGQLAASLRFLASAWMWSEARVRRYLDMLENRHMIQRKTDAGVTVISICKYDEYQAKPKDSDAEATQEPTHHRRTTDANENKGEIRGKEEDLFGSVEPHSQRDQVADNPPPAKPDRFDEFWKAYPKKSGKPKAVKAWANAIKRHDPEKIIAAAKVYAKAVEGADPKYTKHPQGWLNDERFNDPDCQPPAPSSTPTMRWSWEMVR